MIAVLLVRHGPRQPDADGIDCPLSADGWSCVSQLAATIPAAWGEPQLFVCSAWRHATQTATALRDALTPAATIEAVDALTPGGATEATLHNLVAQTAKTADLAALASFAVVGHEPRIGQLTEDLTGAKLPKLGYAEARYVEAESFAHLMQGKGKVVLPTAIAQE